MLKESQANVSLSLPTDPSSKGLYSLQRSSCKLCASTTSSRDKFPGPTSPITWKTISAVLVKNHLKAPGSCAGREPKKLIFIHSWCCQSLPLSFPSLLLAWLKKKNKGSQGSCSVPRTLLLLSSKFFQFSCILSEMWGASAVHWIFMAYTNNRFRVI